MIKEYDIYVLSLLDDTHLEFNNDFSLLAVESMILIPMLWDLRFEFMVVVECLVEA
jgi:hypothetical protein